MAESGRSLYTPEMRKAPFLLLALALPAAADPPVGEKETGTTTGPARRGNETGPGGLPSGPGARRPPLTSAPGKNAPAAHVPEQEGVPLKGAAPEKTGTVNDDESGVARRDSEKKARESARKLADALKVSPPPAAQELPPAKTVQNRPADNGPRTREGLDLVAAASTGFAPFYREAGLRAARGPDGTLELVDQDGSPATPLAVERLRRKIDAEPRALIRRPDLYRVIPADDYKNLVAKLALPGAHESPAFRHIGRSERDFIWTRSCARVSGECNPHAVEREYKEKQEVAPETLRNVAANLGRGGFDGAQPKPELAAQPQAQPPSGWLKGLTQAWSLLRVPPERTRELGLQRLQEAKELTDDGSPGFWFRRAALNISGKTALLKAALSDSGNWSPAALTRARAESLAAEHESLSKKLRDEPGFVNAWALGNFYYKLANPAHAAAQTIAVGVVNDLTQAKDAVIELNEKRDAARALDLTVALGKVGLNFVGLGAGAAIRQAGTRAASTVLHAVEVNAAKTFRSVTVEIVPQRAVFPAGYLERAGEQLRRHGFSDEGFAQALRGRQDFELKFDGAPKEGFALWLHNRQARGNDVKVFVNDAAFEFQPAEIAAFASKDKVYLRSRFLQDLDKGREHGGHELIHVLNVARCRKYGGSFCSRLFEFRAATAESGHIGPWKKNPEFYGRYWRADEYEAYNAGLRVRRKNNPALMTDDALRQDAEIVKNTQEAIQDFKIAQREYLRSARAALTDAPRAVKIKDGYAAYEFKLKDGRPLRLSLPLPPEHVTEPQARQFLLEMIDRRLFALREQP